MPAPFRQYDSVVQYMRALPLCRYQDLVAEGVPLQQASMPSNTSFSNISAASQDIAPDTPHRSPTHPPSPQHHGSQSGMSAPQSAAQQEGMTDLAGSFGGSQGPPAEEDWDEIDVLSGQQQVKVQNLRNQSQESDLPSSPLLASSQDTLLSDKVAEASQLLGQDSMLRNHQEERSDALTAGLSKGAVQTGFRAAGKVSMTDGTSEPVTEALEALGPVGKGPGGVTEAADDKGRIMKASQLLDVAYTPTGCSSNIKLLHSCVLGFLMH